MPVSCHHEEAFRPTRDLLFDGTDKKKILAPRSGLVMTTPIRILCVSVLLWSTSNLD